MVKTRITILLLLLAGLAFSQVTVSNPPVQGQTTNITNNPSDLGWSRTGSIVSLFSATDDVGVGTGSPSFKFHILESGVGEPILRLEGTHAGNTGPSYQIYHNSASPAIGDKSGFLTFAGKDAAGNVTSYSHNYGGIKKTTDGSEAGIIVLGVMLNGALETFIEADGYVNSEDGHGEIVFNSDQNNIDWRMESASSDTGLFYDASLERFGIRTGSPESDFHIQTSQSNSPVIRLETSTTDAGGPVLQFVMDQVSGSPAAADQLGRISFQGDDSGDNITQYAIISGDIEHPTAADESGSIQFDVIMDGTQRNFLKLDSYNGSVNQGEIILNEDSQDVDFRLESNASTHGVYYDSGNEALSLNSSASIARLFINDAISSTNKSLAVRPDGNSAREWTLYDSRPMALQTSDSLVLKSATADPILLEAGNDIIMSGDGNTIMFIDGTNKFVGINETSPGFDLHLKSSTSGGPAIRMEGTSTATLGPSIQVLHNSASPAQGDDVGLLFFSGKDDGGNNTTYSQIVTTIRNPADSDEHGLLELGVNIDGTISNMVYLNGYLGVADSSEVVINENSRNTNFRVESDVNSDALWVHGATSNVGINTNVFDGSAAGVIGLKNGTAPATGTADQSYIYARDVTSSSELHTMDEAGNETQLSPHDPETGDWVFLSRNKKTGKYLRVEMEQLILDLAAEMSKKTGKTYVQKSEPIKLDRVW